MLVSEMKSKHQNPYPKRPQNTTPPILEAKSEASLYEPPGPKSLKMEQEQARFDRGLGRDDEIDA
jgi:hypothetical protein